MKHNIRINGQVKEINCELGSGILDKNGREIFEGDWVKVTPPWKGGDFVGIATYSDGEFYIAKKDAKGNVISKHTLFTSPTDFEIVD